MPTTNLTLRDKHNTRTFRGNGFSYAASAADAVDKAAQILEDDELAGVVTYLTQAVANASRLKLESISLTIQLPHLALGRQPGGEA